MPLSDRLPPPELVSPFVPVRRTPALPLLTAPVSFDVPVIESEPPPELLTEAVAKRVPSVPPEPLLAVDVPLIVTLPFATLKVEDEPKMRPVPVFDVPANDALPDTVRSADAKTSIPR